MEEVKEVLVSEDELYERIFTLEDKIRELEEDIERVREKLLKTNITIEEMENIYE